MHCRHIVKPYASNHVGSFPNRTFALTETQPNRSCHLQGTYRVHISVNPSELPSVAAKPDGYSLVIDPEKTSVVGFDAGGAFYGLMSLLALLPQGGQASVPQVRSPQLSTCPRN